MTDEPPFQGDPPVVGAGLPRSTLVDVASTQAWMRTYLHGSWSVIEAGGEMDLAIAPKLRETLDRVASSSSQIVVDLRGVEFMDCSALRVLAEAWHGARASGGVVRVVAPNRAVRRLLEVSRLDKVLIGYASVEAATVNVADRLGQALEELAAVVRSRSGVEETAESVVALARDNLECDYAGITLRLHDGELRSLAVTDPIVEKADLLQYQLAEGPCADAVWEQQDFAVDDVASDPRWQAWGPAAAGLGLTSLLAARMTAGSDRFGALNLYSAAPRRFTAEDVSLAHVFAHQAATALSNARHIEQLMTAIDGRTLIGQAQGVLMERFEMSPDQAFSVLRRYSQDTNTKLRDVAEELIQTRSLRHYDTAKEMNT